MRDDRTVKQLTEADLYPGSKKVLKPNGREIIMYPPDIKIVGDLTGLTRREQKEGSVKHLPPTDLPKRKPAGYATPKPPGTRWPLTFKLGIIGTIYFVILACGLFIDSFDHPEQPIFILTALGFAGLVFFGAIAWLWGRIQGASVWEKGGLLADCLQYCLFVSFLVFLVGFLQLPSPVAIGIWFFIIAMAWYKLEEIFRRFFPKKKKVSRWKKK
jgi:hypothetical protein